MSSCLILHASASGIVGCQAFDNTCQRIRDFGLHSTLGKHELCFAGAAGVRPNYGANLGPIQPPAAAAAPKANPAPAKG
jgi:hypothetical protein